MPKENTHIFAANQYLQYTNNPALKELLKNNLNYFYLGAIAPDILFYNKNKKIAAISDLLHGVAGSQTNEIIFEMLTEAKNETKDKNLVFILGYISHSVLDIIFHPVIFYLTGNYHDKDEARREKAQLNHKLLETYLDQMINQKFFFHKFIKTSLIKKLTSTKVLADHYKISQADISSAIKRQFLFNKLFRSKLIYSLIYYLGKLGLLKIGANAGLFYGALKNNNVNLDKIIRYKDLISGEKKETSINDLFEAAYFEMDKRIKAAYEYYQGRISREDLKLIIKGESLDTGKVGVGVDEIKFTAG